MEYFVQMFIGSLATAAACFVLLSAYLSVAWLPFREKMEERYHHHNQLKKLTHMGTKTKETPMHYQAAAAQCTVPPPPLTHRESEPPSQEQRWIGKASNTSMAYLAGCWRGHKRT